MISTSAARVFATAALVVAFDVPARPAAAQPPALPTTATRFAIPFLANATLPAAVEFEGAECDLDAGGATMDCSFQQIFLTTTPVAPETCLVTTNRYERTFRREGPARWVSTTPPQGDCGLHDIVTLLDGGGVRWTMEVRHVVTKNDAAACRVEEPVTFTWQNIRRPLPCRFVQPGGLGQK